MTQILFKLRPNSSHADKIATLLDIETLYENKPLRMFLNQKGLEDIYDINIESVDKTTVNKIASMPHVEFCELPFR